MVLATMTPNVWEIIHRRFYALNKYFWRLLSEGPDHNLTRCGMENTPIPVHIIM